MSNRPLQRPDGVISRRHFLYIAGGTVAVTAGVSVLAACGASATPTPTTAPTTAPTAAPTGAAPTPTAAGGAKWAPTCETTEGKMALYSWAGYEGPEVPEMQAFWKEAGISLDFKEVSAVNMVTFMKAPGAENWDAFTVNQGDNNYYNAQGIMSEITIDEVPNLAKMYPLVKDNSIWKIRDGVYNAIPWTIGPLGINYIKGKIEDIKSYNQVLDAKFRNRVGCFDDPLNMISTGACAVELDPGKLTRDELNGPVKDWLMKLKPQLKVLSPSLGDQLTLLVQGDVDIQLVGLLWNIPQGKEQGVDCVFVYPEEGTYGFVDSVAITPWAPNRCAALAYANAVMTPQTAGPLNASIMGIGPTDEINAAVDPAVRDLYPKDIEKDFFGAMKWNVSYYDPAGPYATIEEWNKVWNDVKTAG